MHATIYRGKAALDTVEGATHYNERIARSFAAALARARADAEAEPRVLDFGAGSGTITRRFLRITGIRPDVVERDPALRARLAAEGFSC